MRTKNRDINYAQNLRFTNQSRQPDIDWNLQPLVAGERSARTVKARSATIVTFNV